ncbi:mucin-2 [Passerculus sandwichensis]
MRLRAASLFLLWLALSSASEIKKGRTRSHGHYVCSTWGNNHFKTFDGDVYQFPGLCEYNFVSDCREAYKEFSVHIQRALDSNGHPEIQYILMKIKDIMVYLKPNLVVVDGRIVKTPYYSSGVLIESNEIYTKIYAKLGMVLMWNQQDALMVELDNKFNNHTCGLCGDYNGIQIYNEFIKGDASYNSITYGNMQKISKPNSKCEDPDETQALPSCNEHRDECQKLLTSSAFADCRLRLNLEMYIQACMQDKCACNGKDDSFCLCSTISEYSRQCSHAGGRPGEWRTQSFCPKTCPATMVYRESSSPCMDTCSHLQISSLCEEHYMDGCFCPEGTVYDDISEKGCIPVSQCYCKLGGKSYAPGESISKECEECTCNSGRWTCKDLPCPGTCSVEGGSHFTTFDGKKYTFHGDCYYVLAKGTANESYALLAELAPCGSTDKQTCLKTVVLLVDNKKNVVVFRSDGSVLLNEMTVNVPHVSTSFSVFKPSSNYFVVQTPFGLQMQIQLFRVMQLFVTVDQSVKGELQGLCGNFNGMEGDDFRTTSGLIEATGSAFANTWKAQSTCTDQVEKLEDPCSLSIESANYAEHWCSLLRNPKGPFARCHIAVDPSEYFKKCKYDTCLCEDNEECLCAALSSYSRACAFKGIILGDWRKSVCSSEASSCPGNQVFLYNLTMCQQTCRSLADGEKYCLQDFAPVDGCGCPSNTYLDNQDNCVPISQCPCYYKGSYLEPGEYFTKDGERCVCRNAKIQCTSVKLRMRSETECSSNKTYFDCNAFSKWTSQTPLQLSCHTPQTDHFQTECVSGCVCPEGLFDDGRGGCVEQKDCPCIHNNEWYYSGGKIKVDCNTCTCQKGVWKCTEDVCYGTCMIYGSGHYNTFDGKFYDFDGSCEYVATQDFCGDKNSSGSFSIITENVPCGTTGVTCSKAIKMFLGKTELKLENKEYKEIQRDVGDDVQYWNRTVGLYLVIEASNGVMLIWDKKTTVFIKLSPDYKGKVCGLCGNFDDKANNDFTTRSGLQDNNPLNFGNSWKQSPMCPDVTQEIKPCDLKPHRKSWAEKECSIIQSEVFKICHSKVDPLPYYEACVHDACSCDSGGDCECFCSAVAAYAQECIKAEACVFWRTPDICPIFCDYYNPRNECDWHYEPCGSNITTCRMINNVSTNFTVPLLEGCYPRCPKDKPIYNEDTKQCVTEDQCGCYLEDGTYVPPWQEIPTEENCTTWYIKITCGCPCVINGTSYEEGATVGVVQDGDTCTRYICAENGSVVPVEVYPCPTSSPTTISTSSPHSTLTTTTTVSTTSRPVTTTPCIVTELICDWTEWFDVSKPEEGGGDYETYDEIRKHGNKICTAPEEIECRAKDKPDVSLEELGQKVECNVKYGLICKNDEQDVTMWPLCYNYEIRVNCCEWQEIPCEHTTTPTVPSTSTTTQTTIASTTTTRTSTEITTRPIDIHSTTCDPISIHTEHTTIDNHSYAARDSHHHLQHPDNNHHYYWINKAHLNYFKHILTNTNIHHHHTNSRHTEHSIPYIGMDNHFQVTGDSQQHHDNHQHQYHDNHQHQHQHHHQQSTDDNNNNCSNNHPNSCTAQIATLDRPRLWAAGFYQRSSCECIWTDWFDVTYPDGSDRNSGDYETFENIWKKYPSWECAKVENISCRAEKFPSTSIADLGQKVECNVNVGLICNNKDQQIGGIIPMPVCLNYEISVCCTPNKPECLPTPSTTSTTTSTASTTTSSVSPPISTTAPTSTSVETRSPTTTTTTTWVPPPSSTTTSGSTSETTRTAPVSTTPVSTTSSTSTPTPTYTTTTRVPPPSSTTTSGSTSETTRTAPVSTTPVSTTSSTSTPTPTHTTTTSPTPGTTPSTPSTPPSTTSPSTPETLTTTTTSPPTTTTSPTTITPTVTGSSMTTSSPGSTTPSTPSTPPSTTSPSTPETLTTTTSPPTTTTTTTRTPTVTGSSMTTSSPGSTTPSTPSTPPSTTSPSTPETLTTTTSPPTTTTTTTRTPTVTGSSMTTSSPGSTTPSTPSTPPSTTSPSTPETLTTTASTTMPPSSTTSISTPSTTTVTGSPTPTSTTPSTSTPTPTYTTTTSIPGTESTSTLSTPKSTTTTSPTETPTTTTSPPTTTTGPGYPTTISTPQTPPTKTPSTPETPSTPTPTASETPNITSSTTMPPSSTTSISTHKTTTTTVTGSSTTFSTTSSAPTPIWEWTTTSKSPETLSSTTTTTSTSTTTTTSTSTSITTSRAPTTTTTTVPTTTQTPAPCECIWTDWFDVTYPDGSDRNSGDYETFENIWKKYPSWECAKVENISCRAEKFPSTSIADLGQKVECNVNVGLICNNKDQQIGGIIPMPVCLNYEISVCCTPNKPECLPTPSTTSTTTSTASTTTSSVSPPISTTAPTSTSVETRSPTTPTTTTRVPPPSSTTTSGSTSETTRTAPVSTTPVSTTSSTSTPTPTYTTTTRVPPSSTTTSGSTSETTRTAPVSTTPVSTTSSTSTPTPTHTTTTSPTPGTTPSTPSTASPTAELPTTSLETSSSTTTTPSTSTPATKTSLIGSPTPTSTTSSTSSPSPTYTTSLSTPGTPPSTLSTPKSTTTTLPPETTTTTTSPPRTTTTVPGSTTTISTPQSTESTSTLSTPKSTTTTSPTETPTTTTSPPTTTTGPGYPTTISTPQTPYPSTPSTPQSTTTPTPPETLTTTISTPTTTTTTTGSTKPTSTTSSTSSPTPTYTTTTPTPVPPSSTTSTPKSTTTLPPETPTSATSALSTTTTATGSTTPTSTTSSTSSPTPTYTTTTSTPGTTPSTLSTPKSTTSPSTPETLTTTTSPPSTTTTVPTTATTPENISTRTPSSPTTETPPGPPTEAIKTPEPETPTTTSIPVTPSVTPLPTTRTTEISTVSIASTTSQQSTSPVSTSPVTATTSEVTGTGSTPKTTTSGPTPSSSTSTTPVTETPIHETTTTRTSSPPTGLSTTTSSPGTTTTSGPSSPTATQPPISTTPFTGTGSTTKTTTSGPTPSRSTSTTPVTETPIHETTTTRTSSPPTGLSTTTSSPGTTTTSGPSSPTATQPPISTTPFTGTGSTPKTTTSGPTPSVSTPPTTTVGTEISTPTTTSATVTTPTSPTSTSPVSTTTAGTTPTESFTTTSGTTSSSSITINATTTISTTFKTLPPVSTTTSGPTATSTAVTTTGSSTHSATPPVNGSTTGLTPTTPKKTCTIFPNETYEQGDSWILCNCTKVICIEDNIVQVIPIICNPPPKPTCSNGLSPVPVMDEDGCCWHWECDCYCTGWGDPHYMTFDGLYYSYQGNCTYVLVEEINKKVDNFGVYIDNYHCDARDVVSCPRTLIVRHETQEVRLTTAKPNTLQVEVTVNNQLVALPYKKFGVSIYESGINSVVEIPELKMNVTYNGLSFSIRMPYSLFGNNTQGQCGTCNNNTADDCMLPNGNIAENCETMADHWQVVDPSKPQCSPGLVPTGSPSTTPTQPCKESSICELILGSVFKPCHAFVQPEKYYAACVFDSCVLPNLDLECSSLQIYAATCADQGACIDWRKHTNGVCSHECPSGKEYRACGPIKETTCKSRGQNETSTKQVEGCFCPNGTMLYDSGVDVCVKTCGCVGVDMVSREFGEKFTVDCKDCICLEGEHGIVCEPHVCDQKKVTCEGEGFYEVTEVNPKDSCCPLFTCKCNTSLCTAKAPKCSLGFEVHSYIPSGQCCPVYQCVPKGVCVHENAEFLPNSSVFVDKCQNCVCTNDVNVGTQLNIISCERVPCNTYCQPGYELKPVKGECCGKCVQTKCIIKTSDNSELILSPGDFKNDPHNNCTIYSCVDVHDQLIASTSEITCPAFNEDSCKPGTISFLPNGCCRTCAPLDSSTPCSVRHRKDFIVYNGCRSVDRVDMTECEGTCGTFSLYSAEANSMDHSCSCCRETRTTEKYVVLKCPGGHAVSHKYMYVESCSCQDTECQRPESNELQKN